MDFESLSDIKFKQIDKNTIKFTRMTRKWCQLKYKGHKNGCPNYGKNINCPFNWEDVDKIHEDRKKEAKEKGWNGRLDELFNYIHFASYYDYILHDYKYFYILYLTFDFKTYKNLRKEEWIEKYTKEYEESELKTKDKEKYDKSIKSLTDGKLGNKLYWQSSTKILLRDKYLEIKKNQNNKFDINILSCGSGFGKNICSMEAGGINVMQVYKRNNIEFDVKPKDKIVLCVLLYSNEEIKYNEIKKQ